MHRTNMNVTVFVTNLKYTQLCQYLEFKPQHVEVRLHLMFSMLFMLCVFV